jgi:hypothetical protein
MQAINNILYTPIDFGRFVAKNLFDPNGNSKTAKGLSDNVGLVTKIVKFTSTYGFSCKEVDKLDEQCKSFKKVYSLFTCFPSSIDALKALIQPANPANNNFNSVAFEKIAQIARFTKSILDIRSAVGEYFDVVNFKSLTPLKYAADALDIADSVMGIADDTAKIFIEAGSNPVAPLQVRVRNMRILSASWGLCKKVTGLAITVLGVMSAVLASSVAIPFFVVPTLGLASASFGLFSKYAEYFARNPTHNQVA